MKTLVLFAALSLPFFAASAQELPRRGNPVDQQLRKLGPEVKLDPFRDTTPAGLPLRHPDIEIQTLRPELEFKFLTEGTDLPGARRSAAPAPPTPVANPLPTPAKQAAEPAQEAVWEQVKKSISRALESEDLEAGVKDKVLKAIDRARTGAAEREAHQAALEEKVRLLELEIRILKERLDLLREELKHSDK